MALGETALLEEAIQSGGGDGRFVLAGQSQLPQQGGAGTVRVFSFETLDEIGELRRDGAGLPAVLPRLRRQRLEAAVAVAQRPVQQRVYGHRGALGSGDLVVAGGNLFGAAGELAARQGFENKIRDQPVPEEGDFFGLGIHPDDLPGWKHKAEGAPAPDKSCVGTLRPAAPPDGARLCDRRE